MGDLQTISIVHLLWLFVLAVAVAVLGFVCKKKMSKELTEKEAYTVKWLVGSELMLYVIEVLVAVILWLLGILDACAANIPTAAAFLILFMALNAVGAFVINDAILRKFGISFLWKRVLIYVGVAVALALLFAILMPLALDISAFDSRMLISDVLVLCVALCTMFGVDMYRQNPQSLNAIPAVFILFTIGALMSGTLVVIALVATGLWYAVRGLFAKKKETSTPAEPVVGPVAETAEPEESEESEVLEK